MKTEEPPGIELQVVPEKTYATDLIVRIDDLRARQLSAEGKEALHRILVDMATRLLSESRRLAAVDPKDAYSLVEGKHIDHALNVLVDKWSSNFNKKKKWLSALESIVVGAALFSVSLFVEGHIRTAFGIMTFSAVTFFLFYYFGD